MPQSELEGLTPVGRRAIEERQAFVAHADLWVLGAAIALFALGGTLLLVGLIQWKRRQIRSDESEDLDLEQKRAQLSPATQTEIDDAKAEEAKEEIPEPDEPPAQREPDSRPQSNARSAREAFAEKARQAEEKGAQLLQEGLGSHYHILTNTRVSHNSFILDAVLNPPEGSSLGQLGIDFKFARSASFAAGSALERMTRVAISTGELILGDTHLGDNAPQIKARVTGITIFLYDRESSRYVRNGVAIQRIIDALRQLNRVLRRPVGALIIPVDRFQSLTAQEFMAELAPVWRAGGAGTGLVPSEDVS